MRSLIATAVCISLASVASVAATESSSRIPTQIPAQELGAALHSLAQERQLYFIFAAQDVSQLRTHGAIGSFTTDEALKRLLDGTGLTYRYIDDRTVSIVPVAVSSAKDQPARRQQTGMQPISARTDAVAVPVRMAQAETSATIPSVEGASASEERASLIQLEEVIVTGSQIRGVQPVGAPLIVIDREEINRSGYSSVQQLMESLPQTYGGDAAEDVYSTSDDQVNNSGATGINLRGLNASSTLILLNGRRMALAGGFGAGFTDISTLPLSAVERVEILTDGASAIYGSDAIAGVVNFVLRNDYEGAETRMRYGSVTSGGQNEFQLAQTLGKHWDGGNVLLSYEYHDRGRLKREDRAFSATRDLRLFGGDDFSHTMSRPGNLYFSRLGFPRGQDGTSLTPADLGPANVERRVLGEDFVGESERHSVFLLGQQSLTNSLDVYGEFRYSGRDYLARAGAPGVFGAVPNTHPYYVSPTPGSTYEYVLYDLYDEVGAYENATNNEVVSGTLGARWNVGARWRGDFYTTYGRDKVHTVATGMDSSRLEEALGYDDPSTPYDPEVDGYLNVFGDTVRNPQNVLDYIMSGGFNHRQRGELLTVSTKFDGPLFSLPGGEIKMALGGEYRKESLSRVNYLRSGGQWVDDGFSFADVDRSVSATFGEIVVPIVGAANALPGVQALTLSGAVRYERYSDFGSSADPKFGLTWELSDGVTLRGTYGTSFKAPRLSESLPQARNIVVGELYNPLSPTGSSFGMWLFGSGAGLTPESSSTWTAGMDLEFKAVPGLRVQTTYFDIDFTDRIASVNVINAFLDQEYFAPVLTFDPDDELVQSYLDSPSYTGPTVDASMVEVIMDGSKRNLSSTLVRGLDLDVRYSTDMALIGLTFGVSSSYLFDFKNALVPGVPMKEQVSTLDHPADLRIRTHVGVHRGPISANAFVNYTDAYDDLVTSITPRKVDSWTTVDLTLSYTTHQTSGWLAGTRMFLSANNLLDKDPPFVNNSSPSMSGYDPANADPTGRFISFSVTKEWK